MGVKFDGGNAREGTKDKGTETGNPYIQNLLGWIGGASKGLLGENAETLFFKPAI